MPNHITNNWEVSHEDKDKIDWLKSCWKEDGLDFTKIIPPPKEEHDWYEWNCNNWGTKWNSYEGSLIEVKDPNLFVCSFQTAWDQPTGIVKRLREMGFIVKGLWKDEGDSQVNEVDPFETDHCWVSETSFIYDVDIK